MPRQAKPAQRMQTAQAFALPEQFTSLNQTMFKAIMDGPRAYADGMSALGGEMLRFAGHRWRQDMVLGQTLAKCHQWDEVTAVQQDWGAKAVEDYLAEAGKLVELASKVTTDSWQSLYDATKSAAEGLPAEGREARRH